MVAKASARRGFNIFLLASLVTALSCVIVDGWQFSALLAVWGAGTFLRWWFGLHHAGSDAVMFAIANAWMMRKEISSVVSHCWALVAPVVWLYITPLIAALSTTTILVRWIRCGKPSIGSELPKGLSKWSFQYPLPRIFPCETKHARMFPKRHAFQYSYLQCGFPIIPAGITSEGEAVGGSNDCQVGSWWLRIRAADYLNRGSAESGFYGKLKAYLREQHVRDNDWSYGYLVTAPRFFGYAFNPVSFWYIYDSDQQLKKMILEVNNTFGERRMYLLDGSSMPSPQSTPNPEMAAEALGPRLPTGPKARFADLWMKDFHVSPFNSRKGAYALKALNPFPYAFYDDPRIDNTITLKSSKDHAKLVARLNSTGPSIDPDQLGVVGALRFIMSWWWVGLVTFPRIIREASKIFFKRKLHVWYRPEVLQSSVGRGPSPTEIELYHFFKDFLVHMVGNSQDTFRLTLHSAIPDEPTQRFETRTRPGRGYAVKELEIRVLTPAFYSRLVHYAYMSEAFDRECIFTDEKNRTLWVSRPDLLPLLKSTTPTLNTKEPLTARRSSVDTLGWFVLKKLRCAPAAPACNVSTPSHAEFTTEDVRALPYSELDTFVQTSGGISAREYRRTVTKLFLAQRFSLGFAEVTSLLDFMLRLSFCIVGAYCLQLQRRQYPFLEISSCVKEAVLKKTWHPYVEQLTGVEWLWLAGTTSFASAYNVYELMKG